MEIKKMKIQLVLGSVFALSAYAVAVEKKVESKPNIVLFLVDDMGWQDTSEPFWTKKTPLNEKYRTPNMEKLASMGVKFTNAYACAVCSPSRVSLMTGQNAARHRVTNWTLDYNAGPDDMPKKSAILLPKWNVNGISPEGTREVERTVRAKTLPQYLREAGYSTIHCGKAHFGAKTTPASNPLQMGFNYNIAGGAIGGPGSYLTSKKFGNVSEKESGRWGVPYMQKYWNEDIFLTEALTKEALSHVDSVRQEDKPFFLYMSHYAIHVPIEADKRFMANYDHIKNPTEKAYATMIEGMDKSLGDIMDYLNKNKLMDNTVVMFMSDNGGLSDHGRGGERQTHNLPLSAGKGAILEGGIRVPMMMAWKGNIKPNSVQNTPVIIEDFFPSILEIAGAEMDNKYPIDGKSFVSLAKGKKGDADRSLVFHFPNSWTQGRHNGYGPYSAIRKGNWKYIAFHDPEYKERYRLYHLKNDISEKQNLIKKEPTKAKALALELETLLKARDAQMPIVKATQLPVDVNPFK